MAGRYLVCRYNRPFRKVNLAGEAAHGVNQHLLQCMLWVLCCIGADMAEAPADAEPSLKLLEPSGYAHGKPTEGLECMVTMEDITDEDGNYCEYQTAPSMAWHPAHFSGAVVRRLIYTQFDDYMANVRKADCEADLKRRLAKGPPVWLEDKHGMPVNEADTHICRVWLASDGNEYSAKLWHSVEVRCARARAVPLRQTSPLSSSHPDGVCENLGSGARCSMGGAQEVLTAGGTRRGDGGRAARGITATYTQHPARPPERRRLMGRRLAPQVSQCRLSAAKENEVRILGIGRAAWREPAESPNPSAQGGRSHAIRVTRGSAMRVATSTPESGESARSSLRVPRTRDCAERPTAPDAAMGSRCSG